jgi:hypothetical protein
LLLLAAAVALLLVGGVGAVWWAGSPSEGPVAAPTPGGATASAQAPTTGGPAALAGSPSAAGDAGDGLADAGWNDTGLKEAALPWGGVGAAVAAAPGAAPTGAASPSGPRATPKPDEATAAKTMKKKVFFTVDGGGTADIYVNGQRRGSAPLTLFLEPGEYSIAFRGEGGEQTKDIEVASYGANEYRYEPKKRRITNIHQ